MHKQIFINVCVCVCLTQKPIWEELKSIKKEISLFDFGCGCGKKDTHRRTAREDCEANLPHGHWSKCSCTRQLPATVPPAPSTVRSQRRSTQRALIWITVVISIASGEERWGTVGEACGELLLRRGTCWREMLRRINTAQWKCCKY